MKRYDALIQQCDADIRGGRPQDATKRLTKLNVARIPREWRLPLAKICRRMGLNSMGLHLLTRIAHPHLSKSDLMPTSGELAEYAVLLLRSGAVTEAIGRFRQINVEEVPEVLLYRAFGHFLRWEYREAIPTLEQYLRSPLQSFARLVGQTNLAFAYVEIRNHEPALKLLEEIIRSTKKDGHRQLQSNCHALQAQVYLQEQHFGEARAELDRAQGLFSSTETYDQFLVTKWKLILDGLENKTVHQFEQLQTLAIKNLDWESHRESDLYRLKVDFKRERFIHLYFGSPFEGFRNLIFNELGNRPSQLMYVFGPKSAPRLDLRTGEIEGGNALNPGRKCHQLIEVLLRDLYQPMRTGSLFSALFPTEQFDISSSPDRIRQLIRRTRRWFEAERIPVKIVGQNGFYSLRIDGQFSFRIPLDRPAIEPYSAQLDKIKAMYQRESSFLARDLQNRFDLSKWAAHQIIKYGIEKGVIRRLGSTDRDATYVIVPHASQSSAA